MEPDTTSALLSQSGYFQGIVTSLIFEDDLIVFSSGNYLTFKNILTGEILVQITPFGHLKIEKVRKISGSFSEGIRLLLWSERSIKILRISSDAIEEESELKVLIDRISDVLVLNEKIVIAYAKNFVQIY